MVRAGLSILMGSTMPSENTVQEMLSALRERAGMSADDISTALAGRVSRRTIYRWAQGETSPQQPSDLTALRQLYNDKLEGGTP